MQAAGSSAVAVFRSKSPYLSVPGETYNTNTVVEGRLAVHTVTPTYAFRNHIFTTDDPALADYLRNKKGWIGVFYNEDRIATQLSAKAAASGDVPETADEAKVKVVKTVKSVNAALAYLHNEKKADTDSLKKMSPSEIKAFALQAYHIDFASWNP